VGGSDMLRRLRVIFFYFRADHSMRLGKFDRAASDLSKVIKLAPDNAAAYHDRGVARQGMGDYRGSIDDFDKALEIHPRLATACASRGISWKFLGDFDRAIADQTQAIAISPRLAEAHGELGVVHQCRHDLERSIYNLTTAVTLAPKDPSHLKHRGLALFYRGDFKAAATDLQDALDIADDAYALLFLYLARTKAGEHAILELETRASKLRSQQWPAAIIELYLGRLTVDSALAAAATPDALAEAQFYLGEWQLLLGNRAEAKAALQAAAQSCPRWFIEHTAAIAELKRLE
jgi:lipoprotein NlpI